MDWLKGQFETMATVALKDTKLLSISYWGSQNSRVTVTNTATVKPISLTMVKKVLGEVAGDFVKSETVDKMTESCKRLLAMVCQGNFTMGSLEETIRAITSDAKIQATLRKKLKGRYEKDKALLEKVAGCRSRRPATGRFWPPRSSTGNGWRRFWRPQAGRAPPKRPLTSSAPP